ncbi:Uncharacterized protein Adt_26701 [Abeliophyllum distichum]|uniref:Transposase MuDR plant domain-containing protein n=1 Tax=Abeliophyllum distichum TaxID=126358 RepID=A0ABD1RRM9_9LAMI
MGENRTMCSKLCGASADLEEDPDFNNFENEFENDNDMLYEQNVTEENEIEEFEDEIDDLEYPSSEEFLSAYESSDESEHKFPEFVAENDMHNSKFEFGHKFRSIEEFKKAVRSYGAVNKYNVKFKANDESRAQAVCKVGCRWKIWASNVKSNNMVQVKSYTPEHTCNRDQNNRHCTYLYLANQYIERFKVDPD